MMIKKPVGKIIIYVLVAAVVLCAAGLGLLFLISNLQKINLRQSIISECPFTIAGDADWKIYPNNNQAGLIAAVSEHDGQADRMILILDKSANKYSSAGDIRNVVLWNSFFRISYSRWEDSWGKLEEKNVYESSNYIYLRTQYDSRATLTRIKIGIGASDSFDSGSGEGVLFSFTDPFKVTYYTYGGTDASRSQEYDEKRSSWSAVTTYEDVGIAYD